MEAEWVVSPLHGVAVVTNCRPFPCLVTSRDTRLPTARGVGATADLLLEGDKAQDIAEETGTKDFTPRAASTNATTVLYGTAWTSDTLLGRSIQHLQQQQPRDGIRRVFQYGRQIDPPAT